jgi:hypothetical protein
MSQPFAGLALGAIVALALARASLSEAQPPPPKTAAAGAAAAKPVELEEVSDADFGYAIKIAKGSRVVVRNKYNHTYSHPLPGGLHEYNVSLGRVEAKSLDAAVKNATMMGSTEVTEKRQLQKGTFLVVKAPYQRLVEVHTFTRGRSGHLSAKCTGPAAEKDRLVEMCASLTAR